MRQEARSLNSMRVVAALFAALLSGAVHATDSAREWIARMNLALVTRNYEGVLVHQVGPKREVLRIVHRVQDGRMDERVALVSTDGPGREFVRKGNEWVAYYPEQKIALVQTRNRSYGFLAALNGINNDSSRYYNITDSGAVSLHGRTAQLIRLEPLDALRYGYRFWLDIGTGLPLKTQLVARSGEVLEEIAFVNLSLPEKIPDELLKPEVDTKGFRWMNRDVPMHTPGLTANYSPRKDLLPAGFRVRIFSAPSDEARAQGPRTRFIVSDGIAWVSVFVEKADKEAADKDRQLAKANGRADGVVMMGSSAVYVTHADGVRITVVGEVPPATVRSIAEAVKPE
jgi:sigma-E factor negative regulatory protein RseB